MADPPLPALALIAGPTASGKSALALALAKARHGTVINADSAQVYRDLRVLTARPSASEEAAVPHRLFGHVDGADAAYSAARWAIDARGVIEEAVAADRLPIVVGGTGLYMRTLLDGIAPVPPIDAAIRAETRALPLADAYALLRALDPATAGRLNPADPARIARALEVIVSTGRSIGSWQAARTGGIARDYRIAALILTPPRDWLVERIDRRFAAMLTTGGREEVATLLARTDIPPDASIRRAIGVPELAAAIAGEVRMDEAIARACVATRQYAKRQYTWFRNQPPPDWPRTSATDTGDRLAALLARLDRGASQPV